MKTEDRLTKARVQLILDKCFYGNLAMHLKLIKDNETTKTFCTDGKSIIYNEEFAKSLKDNDLQFILAHEILHCVLLHLTRRQNRNAEKWGFAVDYAVNSVLKKDFGFVAEGGLYKEQFDGMGAEQIYNKLPEMNGQQKQDGYRRYESKDGKTTIEIDNKGNIKVDGKKVKSYDEHKDVSGGKSEIDELEKDWKIQVVKSYEQSKIAGKLPLGMEIFIKDLLQPKLDWRNMMKQFMVEKAKSDMRWCPSNRRFIHRGLYLPSNMSDSLGEVVVIVDNSGSTLGYQQRFFTECNDLLQQYDMNMHLIVVDTEVNDYKVYNKGETINLKYKGGGGTEIKKAFSFLKEKSIIPSVIVVLTDGYTDLNFNSEYPTLWVITKDGVDLEDIKFGMKVKIDD